MNIVLPLFLREPEVEEGNNANQALLLGVFLPGIVQIATQGEPMFHALEELNLEPLLLCLHDVHGPVTKVVGESRVNLRA